MSREQAVDEERNVADATLYVPTGHMPSVNDDLIKRVKRNFGRVIVRHTSDIREPYIFVGANNRFYSGVRTLRAMFD